MKDGSSKVISINASTIKKLRSEAIKASKNAHSPYSQALVGAALLTTSGEIFSGCNVENSSFGATICAERTAICTAVAAGHKEISHIYVYTKMGWPPCGMCRQVISEFASGDLIVIIGSENGEEKSYKLEDLLPLMFTSKQMGELNHSQKA